MSTTIISLADCICRCFTLCGTFRTECEVVEFPEVIDLVEEFYVWRLLFDSVASEFPIVSVFVGEESGPFPIFVNCHFHFTFHSFSPFTIRIQCSQVCEYDLCSFSLWVIDPNSLREFAGLLLFFLVNNMVGNPKLSSKVFGSLKFRDHHKRPNCSFEIITSLSCNTGVADYRSVNEEQQNEKLSIEFSIANSCEHFADPVLDYPVLI